MYRWSVMLVFLSGDIHEGKDFLKTYLPNLLLYSVISKSSSNNDLAENLNILLTPCKKPINSGLFLNCISVFNNSKSSASLFLPANAKDLISGWLVNQRA